MHRKILPALACAALLTACGDDATARDVADSGDTDVDVADADAVDIANTEDSGSCGLVAPGPSRPDVTLAEPTFVHPEPTGPYAVGTHRAWWTDETRDEPVTEDPDDHRVVAVQLFYPTDVEDGPYGPLMDAQVAAVMALDGFPADMHERTETRSRFDVPLSDGEAQWPVVVMSHGLTTYRQDLQLLAEELASHGYVVASLSHVWSSRATMLEDGTLADRQNVPFLPSIPSIPLFRQYIDDLFALMDEVWTPDQRFVLDELGVLSGAEDCGWLAGRLDLEHVGIVGYSFGGATAHHTCSLDSRCDAAIDIDGSHRASIEGPIDRPLLFIKDDATWRTERVWGEIRRTSPNDTHSVRIAGVNHGNFSILSLAGEAFFGRPAREIGFGDIDAALAHEIVADYALSFFDRYVRGLDAPLLDGPAPGSYNEARYEHAHDGAVVVGPTHLGTVFVGRDGATRGRGVEIGGDGVVEPAITETDGRFGVSAEGEDAVVLRFALEDEPTTLVQVAADGVPEHLGDVVLPDARDLRAMADGAGVELAGATVIVELAGHTRGLYYQPLSGAVVAIGEATVAYGRGATAVDPALDATGTDGWAVAFDVPPGEHVVRVAHESMTCRGANQTPGDPDVIPFTAEPGAVSLVRVDCFDE